MRKQYHFRPGARGLDAWDVDRLISLSADLSVVDVPIESIGELDTPYWSFPGSGPTGRDTPEVTVGNRGRRGARVTRGRRRASRR